MRDHAVPPRTVGQPERLHELRTPHGDHARARFAALFDGGIFTEVKVPEPLADPLQFRDQKKYPTG
jgi:acetyl-CoA carboxylase beta subunit